MAQQKRSPIILPGQKNRGFLLGQTRSGKVIARQADANKIKHGLGVDVRKGNLRGMVGSKSRIASAGSGSMGGQGGGISLVGPEIRNPLLNVVNFFLPQNYKVLNQWIRYYDTFNELVGNCIDAHAEYPISQYHFEGIDDPKILRAYEEMDEEINGFQFMLSGSREYELIGEFYPFAHWNQDEDMFDKITILNPDYVVINEAYLSYANAIQIELEPDEDLRRIVQSNDPRDMELKQYLDPLIIRSVEAGENIPIDPFSVAQIARKGSPYDPRGKSIVLRAMKTLLYDDKLIEAQYAVADDLITPKQIWKLGDPQNGYMPNEEDLDDFRQLLVESAHDPLSSIVTHYALQLDIPGYAGKILPIVPERQYNEERILTALYTNKAVLKGEGPGFSAGPQVAFEYLQGRYMSKRAKLVKYMRDKIHVPFALARGFWKAGKDGEKELILPDIHWDEKLRLVEDTGKRQFVTQFRDRMQISWKTVMDVFGFDGGEEYIRLEKERGDKYTDPTQIEKYKQKAMQPEQPQQGQQPAGPEGPELPEPPEPEEGSDTPGFDSPSDMKIEEPKPPNPPKEGVKGLGPATNASKKKVMKVRRSSLLNSDSHY